MGDTSGQQGSYDWSLPVTLTRGRPVAFRRKTGRFQICRILEVWVELDPDRAWWEWPDPGEPPAIRVWRVLDQHGGMWELGERPGERRWTILRRWD